MVCRSFGTITHVDDFCPRIRNSMGTIDYFAGDGVKKIIQQFQDYLKEYSEDKDPSYDMVVYMPLGVLSFLLDNEELIKLQEDTPSHFWLAVDGWYNYRVAYTKMHGYDVDTLEKAATAAGSKIRFIKKEERSEK